MLVVQMQGHLCLLLHGLLHLLFPEHLCHLQDSLCQDSLCQGNLLHLDHHIHHRTLQYLHRLHTVEWIQLVVVLTLSVFTSLLETLVYVMAAKGNTRSLDLLMISAYNTKSGTHSHLKGQTLARVALQMFTTTVVLPVSWLFGHLLFIMHCGSR